MTDSLVAHLVVPVASAADASATAAALSAYEFESVTTVHVVEHTEGQPDTIPVEQAESVAEDAFDAFESAIPDANTELVYDTDVVDAVIDLAADVEASAIAFRPRGGSRLTQFLSGDTALRLVTVADRPVIALPDTDGEQPDGASES
jgi:nucleotide-binding universal stress UspA family protein